MRIVPIKQLKDNYAYSLIDSYSKVAAIIDPSESRKVLKHIEGFNIKYILNTHHHRYFSLTSDHCAANEELFTKLNGTEICGGDRRIPRLTKLLQDGDTIRVGEVQITALHTPCHTSGHYCFYATSSDSKVVFTGDTLFIGIIATN
jgi:hydroxyacylglutathione hydrolase